MLVRKYQVSDVNNFRVEGIKIPSEDDLKDISALLLKCDYMWQIKSNDEKLLSYVNFQGTLAKTFSFANDPYIAIRPMVKFTSPGVKAGDEFIYLGCRWLVISENLAITSEPAGFYCDYGCWGFINGKIVTDILTLDKWLKLWLKPRVALNVA